ncbi:MAG: LuxR family transcriptional regulator [Coriobacteriales bacterium]
MDSQTQPREPHGPLRAAQEYVISLWPSLPFLGFAFCAAWTALAHGTAWLSPGETSGVALTNLFTVLFVAMGASLVALGLLFRRFPSIARMGNAATIAAGALASCGTLALLMVGPAYLQRALGGSTFFVFQAASVLTGVSMGVLYLRLGVTYAKLPLRRAVLYLCYSNLLAVFIYLAVQASPGWAPASNSPSLAFIIAFVALPLLASLTLCLDSDVSLRALNCASAPAEEGGGARPDGTITRPMAFFAVALGIFAFVQAAVSSAVTNSISPVYTLASESLVMLVRVPLLLVFAMFASTLESSRLNFGRLLEALVCVLLFIILLGMVISMSETAWLVPVRMVVFGFEVLTWCMVIAVANCNQRDAATVISFEYGLYSLGTGLGTIAGVRLLSGSGQTVLLVVCAALLVPCFFLLSGDNIGGLFGPGESLQSLLGGRLRGQRAKGDFRLRLEAYAKQNGLSDREAETLQYLVAGRGDSQIAEAMGISYNTARTHVRNVYSKLGVHDRQTLIDVIDERLR